MYGFERQASPADAAGLPSGGASRHAAPLVRVRWLIESATGLEGIEADELAALGERAGTRHFNLVAVGEFKRGKSSLINALIGAEVLPVGVVPLTAIATVLEYGAMPRLEVCLQDGSAREIALAELGDYVTEKGNPGNAKAVAEVRIAWPSPWLERGVRLVDTPGIGSIYRHNTDTTYRFLPQADAVLFLLSVDQPVGRAEYDFLGEVRGYAGKLFFLLNKSDLLSGDDLAESVAFTHGVLAEAMGRPVKVFPVSTRRALESLRAGRAADGGFEAFTAELQRFLEHGQNDALAASLGKGLARLVVHARFRAELSRAALATPVETLRGKLATFEARRLEMEREKSDFAVLLEAEVRRLAENDLTPAVEAHKTVLARTVEGGIRSHYASVRHLPLGKMAEALQSHTREAVRAGWDEFRRTEDETLEQAFQGLVERFGGKVDTVVDELYRFASELFAVPFQPVRAATAFGDRAGFYYKFWDAPGALRIMTVSLLHALPKFIGDRLVLEEALKYGRELTDTQAGRVRYDFARRLDKSLRDFRTAMLERIDATLAGIEAAAGRGMVLDAVNSAEEAARGAELDALLARLDGLAGELAPLTALESGT